MSALTHDLVTIFILSFYFPLKVKYTVIDINLFFLQQHTSQGQSKQNWFEFLFKHKQQTGVCSWAKKKKKKAAVRQLLVCLSKWSRLLTLCLVCRQHQKHLCYLSFSNEVLGAWQNMPAKFCSLLLRCPFTSQLFNLWWLCCWHLCWTHVEDTNTTLSLQFNLRVKLALRINALKKQNYNGRFPVHYDRAYSSHIISA